jgi:hypothetical protein
MAKSVDNYFVNKAIAERAFPPGPMHYTTSTSLHPTGHTPLKGSAHSRSSTSPGRTGFTWSKESRDVAKPLVPAGIANLIAPNKDNIRLKSSKILQNALSATLSSTGNASVHATQPQPLHQAIGVGGGMAQGGGGSVLGDRASISNYSR